MLMAFLSWLWEQQDKLYWLLGEAWDNLHTIIDQVLNWILQFYRMALQYVAARVAALWDQVQAWVYPLWIELWDGINLARSRLENLIDSARAYAVSLAAQVKATITSWVSAQVSSLTAWVSRLVSQVKAAVTSWALAEIDKLRAALNPVLPYIALLKPVLTLLSAANLKRLTTLIDDYYRMLISIAEDPVGYIMAIVWRYGLEWLSALLAHAMGSTRYTLPDPPVWGKKRTGE
jgi:hypothetical protein